jgi:hypothetical protein
MVVFQGWQVNPNSIFGDGESARGRQWMSGSAPIAGTLAERQHALATEGHSRMEIGTRPANNSTPPPTPALRSARLRSGYGGSMVRQEIQERPLRRKGTSVSP